MDAGTGWASGLASPASKRQAGVLLGSVLPDAYIAALAATGGLLPALLVPPLMA